jgi:topoisomerase (DNA) II binding protein 1
MVRRGGADAGRFGGACTHVVACGRVYVSPDLRLFSPVFLVDFVRDLEPTSLCVCVQDDPVCVAARAQGHKVVSELWVDDSLDRAVLADADRVRFHC